MALYGKIEEKSLQLKHLRVETWRVLYAQFRSFHSDTFCVASNTETIAYCEKQKKVESSALRFHCEEWETEIMRFCGA